MKFRMVDQILHWEADRFIRGIKAVSFEEYCLRAPMGESGWLPESLVLESLLQLADWLAILSSDFQRAGRLGVVERAEFASLLLAGESMLIEVTVNDRDERGFVFTAVGCVADRQVVRADRLRLEYAPLASYASAADLRVLYSEIHRPVMEQMP